MIVRNGSPDQLRGFKLVRRRNGVAKLGAKWSSTCYLTPRILRAPFYLLSTNKKLVAATSKDKDTECFFSQL